MRMRGREREREREMATKAALEKHTTLRVAGVQKGLAVAGYYGYLIGVDNKELSMKFVPEEKLPMLAKVGGWTVMHREDLRRVAPLWLEYTKKVDDYLLFCERLSYR